MLLDTKVNRLIANFIIFLSFPLHFAYMSRVSRSCVGVGVPWASVWTSACRLGRLRGGGRGHERAPVARHSDGELVRRLDRDRIGVVHLDWK